VFHSFLYIVLEVFGFSVGVVTRQYSTVSSHQELVEAPVNSFSIPNVGIGGLPLSIVKVRKRWSIEDIGLEVIKEYESNK
jgi:hypothetical protein